MADELTGMFATLGESQAFLRHDLGFHRAVAAGSGNPIMAAIIGTLTEIIWETGRLSMEGFGLRESAEAHRRIYEAIRAHEPGARPARDEPAPRARALGAGRETDGYHADAGREGFRSAGETKRLRRKGDDDGTETHPGQPLCCAGLFLSTLLFLPVSCTLKKRAGGSRAGCWTPPGRRSPGRP